MKLNDALVTKRRTVPTRGPSRSAITMTKSSIDPTRHQFPRDESCAPTQRREAGGRFEDHDLRQERPANEQPNGQQHGDRREADEGQDHRGDQDDSEQGAEPGQHLLVGDPCAGSAARVDVDHRDCGGGVDDGEAEDGEDDAERDRESSTTAFVLPAEFMSPLNPPTLKVRYCPPVTRRPRGKKRSLIPRKTGTCPKYMRRLALTIAPRGGGARGAAVPRAASGFVR